MFFFDKKLFVLYFHKKQFFLTTLRVAAEDSSEHLQTTQDERQRARSEEECEMSHGHMRTTSGQKCRET